VRSILALLATLVVAAGCSGHARPLAGPTESFDYVEYERGSSIEGETPEDAEEEREAQWFNETLDVRLTHITAGGLSFIPIFVSPNCITFGAEPQILNGTVEMTWSAATLSSSLRLEVNAEYQLTFQNQGPSPLRVEFDMEDYSPSGNTPFAYQFVALGAGTDAGFDVPIKMAFSFQYEGKGKMSPVLTDCYLIG
jgi:hypothetical protein